MPTHEHWVSVCEFDELIEGRGKHVEIDGFALAIFLDGGKVFVIDNRCPHEGGPLAEGDVQQGCVVCPWHSWPMRLTDGRHRDLPGVAVHTYETRLLERAEQGTLVQVRLP